jgi:curved DNA-binding protein
MGGNQFSYGTAQQARQRSVKGKDLEGEIDITLEEAFNGTSRVIDIGSNRRIKAKVPPGVQDNSKIRLTGQGEEGYNGGKRGDLFLNVRILPHLYFERDGDNLKVNLPVDFYTAVLAEKRRLKRSREKFVLNCLRIRRMAKVSDLKAKECLILKTHKTMEICM